MTRSTTLARLAAETARTHAWVDEAMFGPLEFASSFAYRRFLCLFYGFQAPLEAALLHAPGIEVDFIEGRRKAGRIAHDLMSLGLTRHEHQLLARRQTIPTLTSVAQAVGWMYSTERLMLQVEALRIRLEVEMPVVTALAHQFLCTYVNTADLRWRQFGTMLDRVARAHDVEEIVASARTSMDALHAWLTSAPATRTSTVRIDRVSA